MYASETASPPHSSSAFDYRSAGALHWAGFTMEQFLHRGIGARLRKQATEQLLKAVSDAPPVGYTPIERISVDAISPAEFRTRYLLPNQPVILEGFGRSWRAVEQWNLEFFESQYGSYRVPARVNAGSVSLVDLEARMLTLAELIAQIRNGEDVYGQNLQGIFLDHPELREHLNLGANKHYLCKRPSTPITSTQLFISNRVSRTFYHCASSVNMFTQIHGTKHWYLVDPRLSAWMHMVVRKDTFYLQSPIDWRDTPATLTERGFPLYNYIPKYEAEIHAGDAIFVPQWWWHAVENMSDSIGVSTHAFNNVLDGHAYMALIGLLNRTIWQNLYDLVITGSGTDESLARRVFKFRN